jgi:hypothetical protein
MLGVDQEVGSERELWEKDHLDSEGKYRLGSIV